MAAYLIVDIDIHDAAGLEEYRNRVPATVTRYGGRFIAKQAKEWYESEEYRPLKAMRFKASSSNLVLVEGV